jgi:predicted CXXCH cytochrome family protein
LGVSLCLSIGVVYYSKSQGTSKDDACVRCHQAPVETVKAFRHPLIKEGRCTACHSTYDMLMHRETNPPALDICLQCHTDDKLGRSHPVGEGIIDPKTGETMTCVSACHSLHGADYKYLLPYENNMHLCLSCHKDF